MNATTVAAAPALSADRSIVQSRNVDVPITIDAEAGDGMAGCDLEDTHHATGRLRDADRHAAWLRRVRDAASKDGYGLVINARIDVFLASYGRGPQSALVADALQRARKYREAGADCVYPIALWEEDANATFVSEAPCPVNILALPKGPCLSELTRLGVARISYASLLYRNVVERFKKSLTALAERVAVSPLLT